MPAVLVHGVPDRAVTWDPLPSHLERDDVVAVELPGFGTGGPAGFGASKEERADWIAAPRRAIGGPVDLVAHDRGCLLAS
ncbi:MAG TPA: alpha/beta fold hydrolase [Acidimicrobiia bacterium]|jgi:pimeloyl-ACP methyl ester carboxylesterase